MLEQLAMPTRKEVEQALLRALLKHDGVIKEFGSGEEIVDEIAGEFGLSEHQRSAFLETIYRKQNRLKKAFLWHRLLFRAADSLAKQNMVSRPTQTLELTKKREWMLTEKDFNEALELCNIPMSTKECLPTKSYEVQKIVKRSGQAFWQEITGDPDFYLKLIRLMKDVPPETSRNTNPFGMEP